MTLTSFMWELDGDGVHRGLRGEMPVYAQWGFLMAEPSSTQKPGASPGLPRRPMTSPRWASRPSFDRAERLSAKPELGFMSSP